MALSPQWLDELRARVTLSTVIMRTDKLQRAGREWKACCPFHDEKSPSFTVNDQKGFYHCFGCGAHGDVIRWMTDQRGMGFMDAVKQLAEEAGMEVPAPDPRAAKQAEKRASLIDVTEAAQQWFFDNLRGDGGKHARDYLINRGFDRTIIEEFGFGYAPDSKVALKGALSQFETGMLVESGMQISVEDKAPYDRFRDRLMLPIQDARGRVIAFGGRILESRDGVAKYLNSPDTPLFDKGRTLYNLHRAGPASRKTDRMVVVEGYMDVIALANAGIEDAVAPLGTALTETQLQMLWRMVDVPVLCFDGDAAGQRAAMRAVERALPELTAPYSLSILRLPDGNDPDDLIRDFGVIYFEKLLQTPTPLVEFIWEAEKNKTELETPEQKASLRQRLIDQAFKIKDVELKKLYRRELVDRYYSHLYPKVVQNSRGISHGLLSQENLVRLRHFVTHGSRQALIRACLTAIARHPELFDRYEDKLRKYRPPTPEVEFAIDVFWEASDSLLDGTALPIKLDEIASWTVPIPYPFLKPDADVDYVQKCLDEAFLILVDIPSSERALAKVKKAFSLDPSSEIESELMRLTKIKKSLLERRQAISHVVQPDDKSVQIVS